nr:unnamed protein product [Callosobruchus chinensis]
MHPQNYFFSP